MAGNTPAGRTLCLVVNAERRHVGAMEETLKFKRTAQLISLQEHHNNQNFCGANVTTIKKSVKKILDNFPVLQQRYAFTRG